MPANEAQSLNDLQISRIIWIGTNLEILPAYKEPKEIELLHGSHKLNSKHKSSNSNKGPIIGNYYTNLRIWIENVLEIGESTGGNGNETRKRENERNERELKKWR